MSTTLTAEQIAQACRELPGWSVDGDALTKTFTFGSFREAIAFIVRVAFDAEALEHHPDWSNSYDEVTIRLTTHHAGNKITAKDLELARKIQAVSWVG